MKVLIVDDDADVRLLWRSILSKHGFDVIEAATGREALIKAHEEAPGVVLLDGHLSDIAGWEVFDGLAADPSTADTPVIFVTGDPAGELMERAARATVLLKPVGLDVLVDAVRAALGRAR